MTKDQKSRAEVTMRAVFLLCCAILVVGCEPRQESNLAAHRQVIVDTSFLTTDTFTMADLKVFLEKHKLQLILDYLEYKELAERQEKILASRVPGAGKETEQITRRLWDLHSNLERHEKDLREEVEQAEDLLIKEGILKSKSY